MFTDNLYTIEHKDENSITIKFNNKNHPIFKAHFPTEPVLPGYLNFDIVGDIFNIEIKAIKKAKFLKKILPNQTITYQRDANKFKVFCEKEEVANFIL